MEPIGISLILIYIVGIALAIWLIGKVVKVVLVVFLLTLLLFGGIAFVVYRDVVDIKANAQDGLMVVLADEDNILAGFEVKGDPVFYTAEQLQSLSSQYQKEQHKEMLGSNFKLFIIDAKMLGELGDESILSLQDRPEDGAEPVTAKVALEALRSNNPAEVIKEHSPSTQIEGATPSQIKGYILASIFTRHIIQSPANAVSQLKKDNLNVYPESAVFKVLQYIPTGLIKSLAGKAMDKGEEAKDAAMEKLSSSA